MAQPSHPSGLFVRSLSLYFLVTFLLFLIFFSADADAVVVVILCNDLY